LDGLTTVLNLDYLVRELGSLLALLYRLGIYISAGPVASGQLKGLRYVTAQRKKKVKLMRC
jgi:hypothetical protein